MFWTKKKSIIQQLQEREAKQKEWDAIPIAGLLSPEQKAETKAAQQEAVNAKELEDVRKEREEEEKAEDDLKLVIDTAKLECKLCSNPKGFMKVNYNTPTIQEKKTATVKEKSPQSLVFMGTCSKSPQSSSPCASVMQLGEWKDIGTSKSQDERVLLKKSTIKCNYGSIDITITDSGQINEPETIDTTEAPVPLNSILGIQAIALITPSKSYTGEFGIDYCEMDDKFEKIVKFQGTDISDIEYIFNKTTNQYKKVGTDKAADAEKQNLIKEMYYSKTYFNKTYLATWMNIKEGITAKVNLTTFFIDKSKKADSEKEFISFKENANFEIKYAKQINNAIKIKVEEHNKVYKDIEIKAIKSFETEEYIDIIDEDGNTVGIIEMAPNKVEELEIKIVPVVLKASTPAIQDTKAEEIYDKAIAAQNANKLNLINTLNQQSLNQAGIKSILIANPKGAEKLVIDVTKEYKNYWDTTGKFLKDWTLTDEERDKTKNLGKKPEVSIDEDGEIHFERYQTEDTKELLIDKKRLLLDELKEDYYKLYGRVFSGILIFVTDLEFDPKENTAAYSENIPLKNHGVIVFNNKLEKATTYAHEISHALGLEHTFFEDDNEMNTTNSNIKIYNDNISILEGNKNKDYYQKRLDRRDEEIKDWEKAVALDKRKILEFEKSKNKNAKQKQQLEETLKSDEATLQEKRDDRKKVEDEMNLEIAKQDEAIKKEQRKISVLKSTMFRTKQKTSSNYMDYSEIRFIFSKNQCNTIKNETKEYYR
jgi:hypothetical protein